jgi:hypothetical protein
MKQNKMKNKNPSILEIGMHNTARHYAASRERNNPAPTHLSEQTLSAIEAREAMLKIADRLEAIVETNQLNHATAFGNLLFLIRGEATRVKIDANELLGKAN